MCLELILKIIKYDFFYYKWSVNSRWNSRLNLDGTMGRGQDVPLITSVTWPQGVTTTGSVSVGVEARPIWMTSTMCVRELVLKIYGSKERGTLFTISPELDLSPCRKFCLFNMSAVMRWWIQFYEWVERIFTFLWIMNFLFVYDRLFNDFNVKG